MIHPFCQNGVHIVLDVCSGAVHVVDRLSFELLDKLAPPLTEGCPGELLEAFAGHSPDEVREAYGELYALYKEGQLFSEDEYEPYTGMLEQSPIKAACLHIAHDCNLRCEYCFASTGDFGQGRKYMSAETGKAAVDYLIERSKGRRNLEMDFFGGEPLMNFNTVKEIVAYARSKEKEHDKQFSFTLTTNGVLLDDDKIGFINRELSNVVLSLDGRKAVNDRVRMFADGSGCYDDIVPGFLKLVRNRGEKDYYVRATFTKYNLDFTKDVLHLSDLGFGQISVEPVVADAKLPYALTEADLPGIFEEYEKLALECIKAERGERPWFNFFHFMLDLDSGPCAVKRLKGCGCGNEYIAVTPDGDVYPCHQFVGNERFLMGNVHEDTLNTDIKKEFAHANIYEKETCRDCWARFYCSGGCNANNQSFCGSIFKPYPLACEMEKKRVECALMIKAVLAEG